MAFSNLTKLNKETTMNKEFIYYLSRVIFSLSLAIFGTLIICIEGSRGIALGVFLMIWSNNIR